MTVRLVFFFFVVFFNARADCVQKRRESPATPSEGAAERALD